MEKKPLVIPAGKKIKGLQVYCGLCNTNIKELCKLNGKPIEKCSNGDKHFFKMYVHQPGTKNDRKTKKLKSRDINEAIIEALQFEKQIKNGVSDSLAIKENRDTKPSTPSHPVILNNVIARYVGWIHNENVPLHRQEDRSKEYIKDIERGMIAFAQALVNAKYDTGIISIEDFNDEMVGAVYQHLTQEKNFGARSLNKYLGFYYSFFSWYAKEYNQNIRNWFENTKRSRITYQPEIISKGEYEDLLSIITPERGIKKYESTTKPIRNLYRPWLKYGIRLGLETGRRREEILNMKFSDIKIDADGIRYIKIENIKVNNIEKRRTENDKKYVYVPVTENLRALLDELGWDNNSKDTDRFILAPEIESKRQRVMADALSRGFTHYYDQLNTGRKLTFKSLRKSYISNLSVFLGGNAKAITGHSNDAVIENHYLNRELVAKAASKFSVFNSIGDREQEMKDIRNKNINPEKSIEL